MATNASNLKLHLSRRAKNDEYYTRRIDIENELRYYKPHFMDKVVYCNCDDPRRSEFFGYFVDNYHKLGLRGLIASCYNGGDPDLFEDRESEPGYYIEYSGEGRDAVASMIKPMKGDGDFRRPESLALLGKSDIVVTNPPFSLSRSHFAQLVKNNKLNNKSYLVICNISGLKYKVIFKEIVAGRAWVGMHYAGRISGFLVPDYYDVGTADWRVVEGEGLIFKLNNCVWLTNMKSSERRRELELTMKYYGNEKLYPRYDNFDAINVDRTADIPMDYEGAMGVPISFLTKHDPEQFEILDIWRSNLRIKDRIVYFRLFVRNRNIKNERGMGNGDI